MNREDLLNIHETLTRRARELMDKKNRDYAGRGGTEPFANFTRVESMGICSTELCCTDQLRIQRPEAL